MGKKNLKSDIGQPDLDEVPPGESDLEALAEKDDGVGDVGTASQYQAEGGKPPKQPEAEEASSGETTAGAEGEDEAGKVPHQVVGKLRQEKRDLAATVDAQARELEEMRRDLEQYRRQSDAPDPETQARELEERFAEKPGELLAEILRAARGERTIEQIEADATDSWRRACATHGEAAMEGYRAYLLEFQESHPELKHEWALVEHNSRDLGRDIVRMAKRYMDIDPKFVAYREQEAEKRGARRALAGDLKGLILDEDPNPRGVSGASGSTPQGRKFTDLRYEERMGTKDSMKSLEALAEA